MATKRDELAQELTDKYPIELLMVAAAHLMSKQNGHDADSFTKAEIVAFMDTLDFKGLMRVKLIAENIERTTLQ
jgi:hypothetical protein